MSNWVNMMLEAPTYKINQSRSHRSSADAIQVLTPQNEQLYFNEVTFTFQNPVPFPLILIVENHLGEVHDAKIPANSSSYTVSFEPASSFPTGLYYWKLAGRGGERIVGKFYVYQTK